MKEKGLNVFRERTESKIRFAQVHLDELEQIEIIGGSDFDRAHQESFLYHLIGAKESFLQELNIIYGANLSTENLTIGKLRDYMKNNGKKFGELSEIYKLENKKGSWLFIAKEMRDHSTHIENLKRSYHLGGKFHKKVHLKHPKNQLTIEKHFPELFSEWITNMSNLIEDLRKSSINNKKTNP